MIIGAVGELYSLYFSDELFFTLGIFRGTWLTPFDLLFATLGVVDAVVDVIGVANLSVLLLSYL